MKGRLWGLVLIVVGAGAWFGSVSIWRNYTDNERAARSQWPTVQGTVLASGVHKDYDGDTILTVEFEYDVEGAHYASKQEWPVGRGILAEYSQANYWHGKTVPVYYPPAHQAKAVVAPKLAASGWQLGIEVYSTLLGIGLVVLGSVFLLRHVLRNKPNSHGRGDN